MKRGIATALACFQVLTGAWAADGFRAFTDAQGRTVSGKVVAFEAKTGKVQIQREENGMKIWALPSAFSEKDQQYIRDWVAVQNTLSEKSLRVSVHKSHDENGGNSPETNGFSSRNTEESMQAKRDGTERYEHFHYEITFENRSDTAIDGIKVEYRCFSQFMKESKPTEDKVVSGSFNIKEIGSKSSIQTNSKTISLLSTYSKGTISLETGRGDPSINKTGQDELLGIWIRIYGPLLDGQPTIRDVCFPESLPDKVSWDQVKEPEQKKRVVDDEVQAVLNKIRRNGKTLGDGLLEEIKAFKKIFINYSTEKTAGYMKSFFDTLIESGFLESYPDSKVLAALGSEGSYYELYDYAVLFYERAASSGYLTATKNLAILYTSCPDEAYWNGPKAVEYAKAALEQDDKSPELLDVLACAYARNNQFDLAVKLEKNAIERLQKTDKTNVKFMADLEARLEWFQNKLADPDFPH